MRRELFNEDESYTDLGREISDKAEAFARKIADEYPDVRLRELGQLVGDSTDVSFITELLCRQAKARQEKGREENEGCSSKNQLGR